MTKTPVLLMVGILLCCFSCVPVKKVAYVQSEGSSGPEQMIFTGHPTDEIIHSGDELYVRISSSDEEKNSLNSNNQSNIYNPLLQSYTVNEEGQIKLAYVGKVSVAGLSLEEASDLLEQELSKFLFLPNVYLRFINTRITVLGEVNRPGVYMFDNKRINILQAVGYAGDITEFGNRKKVLIIREEGAVRKKFYLDLTKDALLESDLYALKSGDVVFIEPLGRKKWGMATVPYNLILTMISTGLFVYSVLIDK